MKRTIVHQQTISGLDSEAWGVRDGPDYGVSEGLDQLQALVEALRCRLIDVVGVARVPCPHTPRLLRLSRTSRFRAQRRQKARLEALEHVETAAALRADDRSEGC